jgi:hypothetical protein
MLASLDEDNQLPVIVTMRVAREAPVRLPGFRAVQGGNASSCLQY